MPKNTPLGSLNLQKPPCSPPVDGADRRTETSTVCPGATLAKGLATSGPAMISPSQKTRAYPCVQVHEPMFLTRQVLVKLAPANMTVPSGIVTSEMNSA